MTTAKLRTDGSEETNRSSMPEYVPLDQRKFSQMIMHVSTTKTILDYKDDFLCVLSEFEVPDGRHNRTLVKEWYPVHPAEEAGARVLLGRPVAAIDWKEATFVDEEGNVFQLLDKGETKPIEVEHLPRTEKTELEVLLETSLKERKTHEQHGDSKRMQKNRNNSRKQQALQIGGPAPQLLSPEETASALPSAATNGAANEANVRLNLRQKLAEVRRRIGYVQKRGHNERNNYSYVTAADLAGAVGDILAELGIVIVPRLESIAY